MPFECECIMYSDLLHLPGMDKYCPNKMLLD